MAPCMEGSTAARAGAGCSPPRVQLMAVRAKAEAACQHTLQPKLHGHFHWPRVDSVEVLQRRCEDLCEKKLALTEQRDAAAWAWARRRDALEQRRRELATCAEEVRRLESEAQCLERAEAAARQESRELSLRLRTLRGTAAAAPAADTVAEAARAMHAAGRSACAAEAALEELRAARRRDAAAPEAPAGAPRGGPAGPEAAAEGAAKGAAQVAALDGRLALLRSELAAAERRLARARRARRLAGAGPVVASAVASLFWLGVPEGVGYAGLSALVSLSFAARSGACGRFLCSVL